MHFLQEKILKLTQARNLGQYSLREIGELIGEKSPQKIKHHLNQLEKKGLIRIDRIKRLIEKTGQKFVTGLLTNANLLAIPILGSANAGPTQLFADENIEGYVRVSSTLIPIQSNHSIFALRVSGPSMNRAVVQGKRIDDGDFVIVDASEREPRNGDIVLSVIGGMANIKAFYWDKENQQIVLMSQSTHSFPPIHIHQDDDFMINGKIILVLKKPHLRDKQPSPSDLGSVP